MGSSQNFGGGTPNQFQHNIPPQHQSFGGPQSQSRSTLLPGQGNNPYEGAGEYSRSQLNIHSDWAVNLYALPDPPGGTRSTQPLAILMKYTPLWRRDTNGSGIIHDASWKNFICHHLSLNKVFCNIQRPITEPGKGKYWVLNVSQGEGYRCKRKRRQKTKTGSSGSDEDTTFVDEPEDFSEDDRSRSGSPGPSSARQERVRRTRGTPYPPPPTSQFLPGSTIASPTQLSIGDPSSLNTYPTMDSAQAQATFGQNKFYGYPTTRTHTHPSFSQSPPVSMRPGPSRSQTAPVQGMISTSPGMYGYGGQVQSVPQQVLRGPLRHSPTEQPSGYPGQAGVSSGGYMDPRNTAAPYDAQYNQGQYGPTGGLACQSLNHLFLVMLQLILLECWDFQSFRDPSSGTLTIIRDCPKSIGGLGTSRDCP
ncbi:hypothetical protein BDZ94DRAFT_1327410 [Collybia nuda]|uniref:Fork-head domain-containing protein n=1 Tax=Collybia nuda TaxID=64659 RepID=A0A9P6CC78_9AGAR|nr:hypothetical protein BDZ94DRAFT_1327410 [Collybia nuda]